MSIETNRNILSRFWGELFTQGDLTVADAVVGVDYLNHDPLPGEQPGRAGLVAFVQGVRAAFPDARYDVAFTVAEGDKVVSRCRITGTHRGTFAGVPATGKVCCIDGIAIHRIDGGQIVEGWNSWDMLGLMQQLGASPQEAGGGVRTFAQMAEQAMQAVPSIKPVEVERRREREPNLLIIDVRDASDIAQTGTVPGAVNISYGSLTYMADNQVPENWRHPELADRTRPIVTTCILGPLGALGGKLLHDMGFRDVHILDGGVQAWIDAGLPVAKQLGASSEAMA